MKVVVSLLSCLMFSAPVLGSEFRILAWNVESNRPESSPVSDAKVIAAELSEMLTKPETASQIVALTEVEPKEFEIYRSSVAMGLGKEVDFVTSATGGFRESDSMMLLVDATRFEIDSTIELHRFGGIRGNFNNAEDSSAPEYGRYRARSPLAVRIIDKKTSAPFWVIVNHLARGEAELRADQAKMLVKWAEKIGEPAIAAGDHNFDFDFKTQKGNPGFDAMIAGDVWSWVKPEPLIDSNWSDDRRVTDRRVDRYPDSILDFIFVANQAKGWNPTSSVVVRPGDFPDSDKTSDHRPILGSFQIAPK
jgi:endonuclease/exonuclease/phosphatase family metal-dependent hydrolase